MRSFSPSCSRLTGSWKDTAETGSCPAGCPWVIRKTRSPFFTCTDKMQKRWSQPSQLSSPRRNLYLLPTGFSVLQAEPRSNTAQPNDGQSTVPCKLRLNPYKNAGATHRWEQRARNDIAQRVPEGGQEEKAASLHWAIQSKSKTSKKTGAADPWRARNIAPTSVDLGAQVEIQIGL